MTRRTPPITRGRARLALALSAGVTSALVPAVRRALTRAGAIDVPNERSSHSSPVPRGGGLAVLAGVTSGLTGSGVRVPALSAVAVAGLAGVGMADDLASDRGGLPATGRLGAQLVAGLVGPDVGTAAVDRAFGALVTAAVVNVVNFMDGINGISALTGMVWGVNAAQSADPVVRATGMATAGAATGFLPWNAPRARVFLGDSGSYLLGGVMSAAILRAYGPRRNVREALAVGAPLLPYAADAAQAIWRRRRAGLALTEAHREHAYQRLVDHGGLSHLQVAMLHAVTSFGAGNAWRQLRPLQATVASAALCAAYLRSPCWLVRRSSTTGHATNGAPR